MNYFDYGGKNMSKSKVQMPPNLKNKCHKAIHTATTAAAAAGAIPIPMSDAIPITAAQIAMIISLGKVFDVTISESLAKSAMGCGVTRQFGRAIATNILKAIPGVGTVVGGVISATTAAAFTEALGWFVADDFYKMSIGIEPENLLDEAGKLTDAFNGLRIHKS